MKQQNNTFIDTVRAQCKKAGGSLTKPRERVLKALLALDTPATAYDIVEKIGSVKPMTVYRALDFFTSQGVVHRIESLNAYMICESDHCKHRDSQYLVCDTCESVEELHNHDVDDFINKALKAKHFTPKKKTLEIHGTCQNCQNTN